jgi:hypothetical protein
MSEGTGEGGGGAAGNGGGGGSGGGEAMVPSHRLREATEEARTWKAKYDEVAPKLAQLDTLATQVQTLEQARAALEAARAEDRALFGAGLLDEDVQDLARLQWSKVPADQRPEGGIGAWLGELKASPDKAPTTLRPFLGTQAGAAAAAPARAGQQAAAGQHATAGQVTTQRLAELKAQAMRTGDWKAFNEAAGLPVPRT